MRGPEDHLGRLSCPVGFKPAPGAEAPSLPPFKPSETVGWHGGRKVIALGLRELKKIICQDNAHGM